jgi:cystathionine gamma-lyase
LAQLLEQQPQVAQVIYPGLASHPQHALARAQLHDFGCMLAITLATDAAGARRFTEALQLFTLSASLGSTESLILAGQLMQPRDLSNAEREWAGVSDQLIRLSVGIEALDDLAADLLQALAKV